MAERSQGDESQDTSVAGQATEDLTVLFPNQSIPIGGKLIAVQEYPFVKWIELKPQCILIIEALSTFADQEQILVDDLVECFEDHFDLMKMLYSESIQQPIEFLNQLKADEMELLMYTWWAVNKHFFLKSVGRLLRKKIKTSDGQTSSST